MNFLQSLLAKFGIYFESLYLNSPIVPIGLEQREIIKSHNINDSKRKFIKLSINEMNLRIDNFTKFCAKEFSENLSRSSKLEIALSMYAQIIDFGEGKADKEYTDFLASSASLIYLSIMSSFSDLQKEIHSKGHKDGFAGLSSNRVVLYDRIVNEYIVGHQDTKFLGIQIYSIWIANPLQFVESSDTKNINFTIAAHLKDSDIKSASNFITVQGFVKAFAKALSRASIPYPRTVGVGHA